MFEQTNDLMVESVISLYTEEAINLGFITRKQHEKIMRSLRGKALQELRVGIQTHLDEHTTRGEECKEMPKLVSMFTITRELSTGRYIVGEPTEEFKTHVVE